MKKYKYAISNNDEFKIIKNLASNLVKLYELQYKQIKPQVDYIINSNINDEKYISQILDKLLEIPYESSYQLFVKLCEYISKFNDSLASEYLNIWNELYDEEKSNDNIQKRIKKSDI